MTCYETQFVQFPWCNYFWITVLQEQFSITSHQIWEKTFRKSFSHLFAKQIPQFQVNWSWSYLQVWIQTNDLLCELTLLAYHTIIAHWCICSARMVISLHMFSLKLFFLCILAHTHTHIQRESVMISVVVIKEVLAGKWIKHAHNPLYVWFPSSILLSFF